MRSRPSIASSVLLRGRRVGPVDLLLSSGPAQPARSPGGVEDRDPDGLRRCQGPLRASPHPPGGGQARSVAKKTILTQMRAARPALPCPPHEAGLRPIVEKRGRPAPNRLNRVFIAAAPKSGVGERRHRVPDRGPRAVLSPVMDLFDRQIIAYTLARRPNAAVDERGAAAGASDAATGAQPLVHTDQGFQYQHRAWQASARQAGATPSMSRKGNCLGQCGDRELLRPSQSGAPSSRPVHLDIEALTHAIHDYIRWYNNSGRRRRSTA